jgi:type I restriction enzyme S subunit
MSFDSVFDQLTLGEVAVFINGDRSTNYPKGDDYIADGIPFISAADLSDSRIQQEQVKRISNQAYDRLRSGKIRHQDILFCLRGSIGKLAFVQPNEVGAIASSLVIVRSTEKIYPRYLYYILCSQAGQQAAASLNNGSAQPNLSVGELQKVKIPLPSIAIQREITSVLGSLDDRITLLRETNTTLEAIAQALFKSWFVDFDPVHAKMQGRAPEGMDEATAALFPDSFEESELGSMPKGWRVGNLNVLAELNPESWSAKRHPERVLYVDLANTKAGQIDEYIEFSFEDAPSRARRVLRCGDVIVGTVRPGNRSFARIASDVTGLTGSTGFAVLRARKVIDQALVFIAATNGEAIDRLSHLADGGAYPAVRPEVVGSTPLVVAPEEIRNSFGDIANTLFASIGANQERMTQLASLRDTLLPRLISGQIDLNTL